MVKRWEITVVWGIVLVLAAMQAVAVSADAPATSTLAVTETPLATKTPAATETSAVTETLPAVETPVAAEPIAFEGSVAVTLTVTVMPGATPVLTSTPQVVPTVVTPALPPATPTSVPTPVPTVSAATPSTDTTYIAVLASETIIPVGGKADSEVFVSLVDIGEQIQRFEVHILFDPTILQVAGQEIPEIETAASLEVTRVDNDRGEIVLVLARPDDALLRSATLWDRVATITWLARREGKSVIAIDSHTQFVTSDGEARSPDAAYDGVVFARAPGMIRGRSKLQGRTDFQSISVTGSLSSARLDRASTDKAGGFTITTSHGEGFYTVRASMPGYLSAESDKPIKMMVGSAVDMGEVTLYGGDINGDDRVDVLDLSYVAWHFDEYDSQADINGDGQVDILDLSLTAGNFGRVGPTVWHVSDRNGDP
jgi:dockerin type I repeat protein